MALWIGVMRLDDLLHRFHRSCPIGVVTFDQRSIRRMLGFCTREMAVHIHNRSPLRPYLMVFWWPVSHHDRSPPKLSKT
jgi:hypothetical protein